MTFYNYYLSKYFTYLNKILSKLMDFTFNQPNQSNSQNNSLSANNQVPNLQQQ